MSDNQKKIGNDDVFGEREKKRLEFIKQQMLELQAEANLLANKEVKAKRKEDNHEKFLLGAAVLADLNHTTSQNEGAGQKQKAGITALLDRAIVLKKDRDFLNVRGWNLPEPSKPSAADHPPKQESDKPEQPEPEQTAVDNE